MENDKNDGVLRLVGHPIPWPNDNRERPGLMLRWRVTLDEEEILASSKRPYEDGSAALAMKGYPDESMVTFRHEGKDFDSFNPIRLSIAAKPGLKRIESLRLMKEKMGISLEDGDPTGP